MGKLGRSFSNRAVSSLHVFPDLTTFPHKTRTEQEKCMTTSRREMDATNSTMGRCTSVDDAGLNAEGMQVFTVRVEGTTTDLQQMSDNQTFTVDGTTYQVDSVQTEYNTDNNGAGYP